MTLNEYQELAARTARPINESSDRSDTEFRETVLIRALGLAGESGEVCDLIKKAYGHSHGVDVPKLVKELGDVLWYVAMLADVYNIDLDIVAMQNVNKLKARYPEGFTVEASKTRVE